MIRKYIKLRRTCPICRSGKYRVIFPSTFSSEKHLNQVIFSARRIPDRIHGTIIRCHQCQLVRTLEKIETKNLSRLYSNSLFTYSNLTTNLKTVYYDILANATRYLDKKSSFLEIGCGNGFLLDEIKKLGFRKVWGIEPSVDAIRKASNNTRKRIKPGILRQGIFPNSSFDLIAAFQVFDHIPNPNQFLKICRLLLRAKGLVLLMNHDVNALSAKILGERSPIMDIEHTYLYSQETISKILEKNGFFVLKAYSPFSIFSVGYLIRLFPIPFIIKRMIENSSNRFLSTKIKVYPGNLCVIARKL